MNRAFLSRMFCVLALTLLPVAPVAAYDNPYNPAYTNPYGPTLAAATPASAGVIRAVGNLPIQQARARIVNEQANQATIQTQRMAFDEGLYEMARTPSYSQELDPWTQVQIRRDIAQPTQSDIDHGDTLNRLMPYVKALVDDGTPVPPIPVSPDTLNQINVEVGTNGPSAGLLRDAAHLSWPLDLKGPAQAQFDQQLATAVQQAETGTLTPATYTQLVNAVNAMQDDLRTKFFQGGIDTDTYQSSKAFLDDLDNSLAVLQRPDAARFLDGTYAAHGNTVPELVENMAKSGLQFAPATPGAEAAYVSLHNAFVTYIRSAESSGFAAAVAPPHA